MQFNNFSSIAAIRALALVENYITEMPKLHSRIDAVIHASRVRQYFASSASIHFFGHQLGYAIFIKKDVCQSQRKQMRRQCQ
jgi:hypothetical protein